MLCKVEKRMYWCRLAIHLVCAQLNNSRKSFRSSELVAMAMAMPLIRNFSLPLFLPLNLGCTFPYSSACCPLPPLDAGKFQLKLWARLVCYQFPFPTHCSRLFGHVHSLATRGREVIEREHFQRWNAEQLLIEFL